ncbi:hypothetical protein [Pseudocolwellia sp. HL-MZ7]|uniref:hypothetical protein n=1 Tax=Pseudocolwellia sp. HL-MZ7 TaxID=3400627 RepID=UPI003CECF273
MKHIFFIISILMLSACGGGGNDNEKSSATDEPQVDAGTGTQTGDGSFTLHNIRFDSKDYYEGELVTITEGTTFDVQWVSPTSAAYIIDFYLSSNDQAHSDNNKIVGLKCGSDSLSLCPNATGEVQCEVANNNLTCSIGSDFVGSENFQDKDLSSLTFIVKGCDAFSNCDVKTFDLSVQSNTDAAE